MSQVIEQVYAGRDNTITLTLSEDGIPVADHTQFIRVVLKVGVQGLLTDNEIVTFDSNSNPSYFDLTQSDSITIKLGQATLPKGRHWCDLILYTGSSPNGVVWEPKMEINFQ